jgi:hypothetical protein
MIPAQLQKRAFRRDRSQTALPTLIIDGLVTNRRTSALRHLFARPHGGDLHHVLSLGVDGFHLAGKRTGKNTRSVQGMYMICFNIPIEWQYDPENMFLVSVASPTLAGEVELTMMNDACRAVNLPVLLTGTTLPPSLKSLWPAFQDAFRSDIRASRTGRYCCFCGQR